MKKTLVALGLFLFTSTSASANSIYFFDDFNGENGGTGVLNYNKFANWTVSNGTVDLIGNGFFDFQPSNGLYLDMDGSTGDAGKITTNIFLDAGSYFLDFYVAGNQRNNGCDSVHFNVGMGSLLNATVTASQNVDFVSLYSLYPNELTFSVATAGVYDLSLEGLGGDNIGALIDNVKIVKTNSVPEPTAMLLFGTGLAGLAAVGRRKRN